MSPPETQLWSVRFGAPSCWLPRPCSPWQTTQLAANTSRPLATEAALPLAQAGSDSRSEEHTSELQSLMRTSYAVFCLKKKNNNKTNSQRQYPYAPSKTYSTKAPRQQ